MFRLVAALAVLSMTFGISGFALAGATAKPVAPKFRAGQRWDYKTRPGEEKSTLTILKLETEGEQSIVHIAIEDVHISNRQAKSGFVTRVGHAPIEEGALARSVTKLRAAKKKLPPFEEGYDQWKTAHGGIFTITVAEALATVETSLE